MAAEDEHRDERRWSELHGRMTLGGWMRGGGAKAVATLVVGAVLAVIFISAVANPSPDCTPASHPALGVPGDALPASCVKDVPASELGQFRSLSGCLYPPVNPRSRHPDIAPHGYPVAAGLVGDVYRVTCRDNDRYFWHKYDGTTIRGTTWVVEVVQ